MVPNNSDTDRQVRTKINTLTNKMVSEVSGQLAGQGIGFSIKENVDLFTQTPEQELTALYKDPVMKTKIQQAVQMF